MTDPPLDPTTLEALRGVLAASEAPVLDPERWHRMLRGTFEAGDDALHGDVTAEELIPQEWSAPAGDASVSPASGEAEADDGDGWSLGRDSWSDHDPANDLLGHSDDVESDGGDLT